MKCSRPLVLCALAALAACDGKTARPHAEPSVAGGFASAATAEAVAKSAEPGAYRLTMDAVRRTIEAQRNLALATGADPRAVAPQGTETIDEQVAKLEAAPALRAAVEDAGLTPREHVVASWVLFQAGMAQGVIDGGARPEAVLAGIRIHPENVEFFRAHREQIARLQKAMEDEVNEGEVIHGPLSAELADEN